MTTTLMAMFFAGKIPCHKKTLTIQELKYFESSLIRLQHLGKYFYPLKLTVSVDKKYLCFTNSLPAEDCLSFSP